VSGRFKGYFLLVSVGLLSLMVSSTPSGSARKNDYDN
jgi:hypothetical protein